MITKSFYKPDLSKSNSYLQRLGEKVLSNQQVGCRFDKSKESPNSCNTTHSAPKSNRRKYFYSNNFLCFEEI